MPLFTSIGTAFYFVGSGGYVPPVVPSILFAMGANKWAGLGDNSTVDRSSPVGVSGNSWTMIAQGTAVNGASAASNGITLAIRNDNTLWGWGRNYTGQFGGTTLQDYISSPVQIGTNTWSTVAVIGVDSLIGIDTTGKLYTWGRNIQGSELGYYGSTGNISFTKLGSISIMNTGAAWGWGPNLIRNLISGDNATRSYPVQIDSATTVNLGMTWLDIATSGGFNTSNLRALGITRDTRLWSWGGGINGGLGLGDTITRSSITQIGTSTGWSKVVVCSQAGATAGIAQGALKSDGTLWMWGINTYGWHGQNDTINRSSPVQVSGTWLDAAAGEQTVLGIKNDGTLWSWGFGVYLGTNDLIDRSSPVQVSADTDWQSVWSGRTQMFAIKNDGKLFAWGLNDAGSLGLGDRVARSSPVQVSPGTSFVQVVSGYQGSNAITNDGKLYGWGGSYHGDAVTRSIPVQIGSSSWTLLGTGGFGSIGDTYGLTTAGTIFGWGYNSGYELGDGTSTTTNTPISLLVNNYKEYSNSYSPVQIGTSSWASVAADRSRNVYAITAAGQLFAWGFNQYGTVGANDTVARSSPVQIKAGTSFIQVAAPPIAMLALDSSYNLWASGYNGLGSYGNNTTVTRSSPVQVTTSVPMKQLAVTQNLGVLALSQGGKLFAWGNNQFGELGLGDAVSRSSPTQVGFTYNSYKLAFGGLISDGFDLWTWGVNTDGQLGDDTTINRSSPIQISSSSSWVSLARTTQNTFAIDSLGKLYGMGGNGAGNLGLNDTIKRSSLTQIGSSSWTSVSAGKGGTGYTLAIRNDGTLWGWGSNGVGNLGDANYPFVSRSSPIQIGTDSWNMVSAGFGHTEAIASDGSLWAWGDNTYGQLGNVTSGTYTSMTEEAGVTADNKLFVWANNSLLIPVYGSSANRSSPIQIGTSSWTMVAGDSNNTLAIRSDGKLFTWGNNSQGELGLGDRVSRSSPTQVGTNSWSTISCWSGSVAAIRSDGLLFGWGSNQAGQLANGTTVYRSSPVQVSGGGSWIAVGVGSAQMAAITTGYKLYCAGLNSYGELGQVANTPTSSATFVSPVSSTTISWVQVAVGNGYIMGRISTGAIYAWGQNFDGQLGINVTGSTGARSSITQIGTSSWTSIGTNSTTSFGIRLGGSLFAWGYNTYGQLGLNLTTSRSSPVQVGTSSWSFINTNNNISSGTVNNQTYVWGLNTSAQLGVGDITNKSSPTQLGTTIKAFEVAPIKIGSSSWTTVTAGAEYNTYAIRTDGGLFTWGLNSSGQLGLNLTTNRSSPVQVGTSSWSQVTSTGASAFAIDILGRLFAWGSNNSGQLGLNLTTNRSSPVQVGTSSWSLIPSQLDGDGSVMAQIIDGRIFAWGYNGNGSIGINDRVNRSSPVQLSASFTTGISLPSSLGSSHSGFLYNNTLYLWGYNGYGQLGLGDTVSQSSPSLLTTGVNVLNLGYYDTFFQKP